MEMVFYFEEYMTRKKKIRKNWVTVGGKLLVGITLTSNLCIGMLLYMNFHANQNVETKVAEVLEIREHLNHNLRETIATLQLLLLSLPGFFELDPKEQIIDTARKEFSYLGNRQVTGRDSYSRQYNRNERRDLANHRLIVQAQGNELFLSAGHFNRDGTFSDSVQVLRFQALDVEQGLKRLQDIIQEFSQQDETGASLRKGVEQLQLWVADQGLEAEKTRTDMLNYVDRISATEEQLQEERHRQRRFTLGMGVISILANMGVLYMLTGFIVERPLYRLTGLIDAIRNHQQPEVPYLKRRDQIGVLAGAIHAFSEAMMQIREEDNRRVRNDDLIKEIMSQIPEVIGRLEGRAKELLDMSDTLQLLADTTGSQSESVAVSVADTTGRTEEVSVSTVQLQQVVTVILNDISCQNKVIDKINEGTSESLVNLKSLNKAIEDINTIIHVVREINSQTNLLALNATIEAARAGEYGKGFGVVASEVKSLSQETGAATQDVMEKIEAIEKVSQVFINNLKEIDEQIQSLNVVNRQITTAVEKQEEMIEVIAGQSGQTFENTKVVSASIREVNQVAGQTRDVSLKVNAYSAEIAAELTALLVESTGKLRMLGGGAV